MGHPTAILTLARFTPADWTVLALYFVALAFTGWHLARRARRTVRSSGDYFLAGRSMPTWAVAVSILATTQSAATVIGVPGQSYAGDLTYLVSNIGGIVAAIILAWVLIPRFYAANATTPYELLESRFGPGARKATSWTYLVGRIFASGSRLYIGSLPAAIVVFGDVDPPSVLVAVAIMTAVGVLYTLAGGIRSVIWTDVIQAGVYLGSAIVIIAFLLWSIDAPIGRILSGLRESPVGDGNKLTIFRSGLERTDRGWRIDFTREFTLLTAVTGVCLLAIASHGLDQDQVQRMLTCRNARQSARSLVTGVLIGIPAVLIYLVIGLLLFVYYQRPDLTGTTHTPGGDHRVMLQFIIDGLPAGLTGLVMAGLFAAGLSSVNSTLNSMSSAFMNDTYRQARPGRDDRHYLNVGRLGVIVAGLLLGGFASACVFWFPSTGSTLLVFALSVMNFAYAGLLGVFFTAILTKRGTAASAIAALVAGFIVVASLEPALQRALVGTLLKHADFETISLAPQWRLVLGTVVAFAVCASVPTRDVKRNPART
ncbi:MAG: sodium:solute symporter [Phycisphaeraceae bacterium]|nr:sodium:solute symporter [Phycisphaeraceae bacterium]